MALQENIRYVREKKIAGLLNEMVLHILSKTPEEPLDELIEFLEKRKDKGGKTNKYQSPAASSESRAQPAAAVAAIPAPVPQAQTMLSATPRNATWDQGLYKSPRRSEAIEEPASSLLDEIDTSADYPDPQKTDKVLAEMFTNELIFRHTLEPVKDTPPKKKAEASSLQATEKLNTIQLQTNQANLLPMMKEYGINDTDSFINFATLDIVGQIIKNEVRFQKKLNFHLPDVAPGALKYALHAQQNSEAMLDGIFKLEKTAIATEMQAEGGMAGTGTLAYLNVMGTSIIKQIKVLEAKQDKMFLTVNPQRGHTPLSPFVDVCQQFLYNEHTFHKLLHSAKSQAQGSRFALNLIAKASRNSHKLEDLIKECCLNCFFTEQGKAPANHDALIAELQSTKEQIREVTHELKAVSNELSTNIYSGAVHSASQKMSKHEESCKTVLDQEAEKAFCVPDLEASRDKSDEIANLLAKIQHNQQLIAKLASQK